jgi:VIT1/CCC1 family predicted Fe2+/Mn2+ transporter
VTHVERHIQGSSLRDMILGGQDGLVNVLGVILGAAAADPDPRIILSIGLAATFAESLAMGAVAYTSFKAEKEHYDAEWERERREIVEIPEMERAEVREIYEKMGFQGKLLEDVVAQITSNEKVWLEVMMSEELGLKPLPEGRVVKTAFSVGLSCMVGSLIPLLPFFIPGFPHRIFASVVCSALMLAFMGFYKGAVTKGHAWRSAVELTGIGMICAVVGYGIGLVSTHICMGIH